MLSGEGIIANKPDRDKQEDMPMKLPERITDRKQWYIKTLLLSIYVFVIAFTWAFMNISASLVGRVLPAVFVTLLLAPVFFRLLQKVGQVELAPGETKGLPVFLCTFLIVLTVECLWYAAYSPGCFSTDSVEQMNMAVTGQYNDWHPYWQTIITFTLPLKLTGSTGSIVLIQILWFSLTMAYTAYVINRHAGLLPAVIATALVALNPYVSRLMMYPWKDIAFGTAGCAALAMATDLYFDRERRGRLMFLIPLGLIAANATLFRHNGILFTAPLILAAVFCVKGKKKLYILLSFLLMIGFVKIPLAGWLGVEKPGNRVTEITGLPMTVIGNVAKEAPEKMDEELSSFAYSVAPAEQWKEMPTGNFNMVKWYGANTDAIEEAGTGKVLQLMLKSFRAAPTAALRGLIALTDLVYGVETGLKGSYVLPRGSGGIAYSGNAALVDKLEAYNQFTEGTVFRYLRTYGVALLTIMTVLLAKFRTWKKDWKKLLLVSSLFVYDFGTMLLLTGDDSRFFWITHLVAPMMVSLLLAKDPEEKGQEGAG